MKDVELLRKSVDSFGPLGMNQSELAAALGVTQPSVSAWLSGKRRMSARIAEQLRRAWEAFDVPSKVIGHDWRTRAIEAPSQRWEPVFTPVGRYRLPLHLDWSGTPASRWRSGSNPHHLIETYTLVIDEGRARDVVWWVDPGTLAEYWPIIPVARSRRPAWEAHLESLGYGVGHFDVAV